MTHDVLAHGRGGRWWVVRLCGLVAPAVYGISLAWWAASWNLRFSVLMSWVPLEPTVLGTFAVAACVLHRLTRLRRPAWGALLGVLLVAACFAPGVLESGVGGYGSAKVAGMGSILLPVVLAAVLLLDTAAARLAWVAAQVLVGLGTALAATLASSTTTEAVEAGRFTLATVDTISTSRVIGAAVVGLVVVGMCSPRLGWVFLPLAFLAATVMVQVGSRGPLLSAGAAIVLAVVAGGVYARRRSLLLLVAAVVGAGLLLYLRGGSGSGSLRILGSLDGGLQDDARQRLLSDAVDIGLRHPGGVGWGDFASFSQAGTDIANQDGVAYPHNLFAEVFVEGGVLAVTGLVLVLALALRTSIGASRDVAGVAVLAALVYWLVNAQFSGDVLGNWFLWITLAGCLTTAGSRPAPRTRPPRPPGEPTARLGRGAPEVAPSARR